MHKYASVLSLAVLTSCGSAKVEPEPVYRYINVRDGSRIQLGEPFQRPDVADRTDDTTFVLRPGTFGGGGTAVITAYTDTGGILRSLTFVYDGSEAIETKIRDYTASLGDPVEVRRGGDRGSIHVWQDTATRFELYFTPAKNPTFWSRLIDRQRSVAGAG